MSITFKNSLFFVSVFLLINSMMFLNISQGSTITTKTVSASGRIIYTPQYDLTLGVLGSGSTDPASGVHPYDEGVDVDVLATPATGWELDHWELDGVDVGDVNPYTVTMDDDHALTAVFTKIVVPPPSGDITYLHIEGNLLKDEDGNTVWLRGVNKQGFETTPAGQKWFYGGYQVGWSDWDLNEVRLTLDEMKSWGINSVRFHTVANFWLSDTENFRTIIKQLCQEMLDREMYMIFDLFAAVDGSPPPQDAVPWGRAPLTTSQNFIDYWISVASEMKGYPNFIIDTYNEPHGNRAAWFAVVPSLITALRNEGYVNPIIVQWDWTVRANGYVSTMQWVFDEDLMSKDPLRNILHSCHFYSDFDQWNTRQDFINAFTTCKLYDVAAQFPLYVGECGDHQGDTTAVANFLDILNEEGWHWQGWWWLNAGNMAWFSRFTDFPPTAYGQVFRDHLPTLP